VIVLKLYDSQLPPSGFPAMFTMSSTVSRNGRLLCAPVSCGLAAGEVIGEASWNSRDSAEVRPLTELTEVTSKVSSTAGDGFASNAPMLHLGLPMSLSLSS
jgi:hypothetical protein